MSTRKMQNLSAVVFIGLFVLTRQPIFLWLLAIGLVVLHPDRNREKSIPEQKNLVIQIQDDARRFGIPKIKYGALRTLLVQVYQKFNLAKENYPHLQSEYREVINEMWTDLAACSDEVEKQEVVSSVLLGWPLQSEPKANGRVQTKLSRVRELSQQWDEAKREALGGAHV